MRVAAIPLSLALLLAGCAGDVHLQPGPRAPDPVCAAVIQALPQELGGALQTSTTAQATVAWGPTEAPITLRCGVDEPGPTTDRCVTVESGGSSVDWINPEAGSALIPPHADDEVGSWTFITYGRSPAIEVVVPAAAVTDQPDGILVDLASAIQRSPASRFCTSATQITVP